MYAKDTRVPVERSKAEILALLEKSGADQIATANDTSAGQASILFRATDRYYRFTLRFPSRDRFRYRKDGGHRPVSQIDSAFQNEHKRLWRALLLVIKAKIESVESGIETMEQAFFANVVLPDKRTVGEALTPMIERAYSSGETPNFGNLLPYLPETDE